jgi:RNA polymerase sigma-70 factor (ECF subfamily)
MGAVTSMDEEQLVRRVARGDRRAFDDLYRRTSPWLAARLRRRCGDEDLVAEVMQETYLAVWRAAAAFAGASVGGSAVGWLWTIAARRLVDAFRRRARDAQVPLSALLAPAAQAAEVLGALACTTLAGEQMADPGQLARNVAGLTGLVAPMESHPPGRRTG